jgi:hypothetical protein
MNILGVQHWLVVLIIKTDPNQAVSRYDLTASRSGSSLNSLGDDSFFGVSPSDTIPWRRFMTESLGKVQDARRYQQSCTGQHQPRSGCEN